MFRIVKRQQRLNATAVLAEHYSGELFFGSGPMLLTLQVLLEKTISDTMEWYATVHIVMYDIFGDQRQSARLVATVDYYPVICGGVTPLPLIINDGEEFAFTTRYYPDPNKKEYSMENCIGFFFQGEVFCSDITANLPSQCVDIVNTDISPTWIVGVRHIILTDPPL